MITIANFKDLLLQLGFSKSGNIFYKDFPAVDAYLRVDFDKQELIYPEDKGLKINERQTCNFKANENFVVFECVCRLFEKGYKPQHIELEPRWQVGHGASGGRADILIHDNDGKALLFIECKTWGNEFDDAWKDTLNGKGQLFTYAHQERSTQYLCLYASGLEDGALKYASHIIAVRDNDDILKRKAAENPPAYRDADSAKELYEVWKRTYECDYATRGIFEPDVQPYQIGKAKYTVADLQTVTEADIQPKYHEFATILRQHNVSGRENAFDKLVNLFLCKIVDEKHNPNDLQFYWRGIAFDTYFDLIDRLQRLSRDGMGEFLKEDVTYIDNQTIRDAFKFFRNDPDATRDKILEYFRRQKYFTNNDFSFLDVHNEQLFYQNAAILLKIVRMLQDIRLNGDQQNQFLGDMFEFFLDQGFKQTEGQFFTPLPVTRFIILSLPSEKIFSDEKNPPKVIDYACGAGHFLTEMASQLRCLRQGQDISRFYSQFYGIEKEYRLSKVAKVSAFMYNQDEINIIYADALARHPDIPEGAFALLVSNPPYSVKGFLETLPEAERARYALIETVDPKSYPTNNAIEAFFLERARQLLAPRGVAGIITPSSILSNAASVYTRVREILLQNFDIIALVELGSGTFGKTGTNTVTLFMRRKDDNPAPADHYHNRVNTWFDGDTGKDGVFADAHLLQAYCDHIGIPVDDYRTLLQSNPSRALLDTEIFKEYRRAFDASSEVKALQKQKSFQQKIAAEQRAELDRRFIQFARGMEREKLYYFILAYTQPCPVIVVRSPQGTEEMKKFLGYEWSAAKGQEGIKYLRGSIDRIETPLFDLQDRNHPEKISTLIRKNFVIAQENWEQIKKGKNLEPSQMTLDIPATLQPYATLARLVDLLDFSRVSFDKQISLAPKKITKWIQSKWEYRTLDSIAQIQKGESITAKKAVAGSIKVVAGGTSFAYFHNQANRTPNIITVSASGANAGYINFWKEPIFASDCITIQSENELTTLYLYYVLKEKQEEIFSLAKGLAQPHVYIKDLAKIQIPIPPADVQDEIVKKCQEIDAEVEQAEQEIRSKEGAIQSLFLDLSKKAKDPWRLSDDSIFEISIGKRVLKKEMNAEGKGIPVYSANVYEPFGYIEKQLLNNFAAPSVLWGIDGDWMVRYMPANQPFNPTDHCGILRMKKNDIFELRFLAWALEQLGKSAGFSRHFRASIDRIKGLTILAPPFQEQKKVSSEVEGLDADIQSARAVIASAPARLRAVLKEKLKQISLAPKKGEVSKKSSFRYEAKKASDLYDILIGGTPQRSNPDYFGGSNLWVSISDMTRKYITETKEEITNEGIKASNVKKIKRGTVLYSFKLTIGKVAIAGADLYTNEAIAAFVPKTNELDSEYLYYFLESGLISFEDKTANIFGKSLNIKLLNQIQIPVPPPKVQAQIVAECQEIDEEVELAENAIQRYEQEFTALFKEIGDVVALDSVVSLVEDRVDPKTQQGKVFYIGLENIESGTGELTGEPLTDYSAIKSVKTVFKKGDILYGKLRPNLNKVYLAQQDGICSTDILVFRPRNEQIGVYLSRYLLTEEFNQKVVQTVSGQQLPRTSWEKIRVLQVRIPSDNELESVIKNILQIQTQLQSARAVIASAPARRRAVLKEKLGIS